MRLFIASAALAAVAFSASAQDAQRADLSDWLPECGVIATTQSVSVAEAGGKYSLRDFKKLAKGDTCLIPDGAIVCKIGTEKDGGVMVRYANALQHRTGFCPAWTPFVMALPHWLQAKEHAGSISWKEFVVGPSK